VAGGTLQYAVGAKPDGTVELSGTFAGGATTITFGPNTIDATVPAIGPDGFPNDEFFYDSQLPFTQTSAQGTLAGTFRMRHIVPTP